MSRQRPLVPLLMNTSAPPSKTAPPSGATCVAFAFIHAKLQCLTIAGKRASSIGMSRKQAMRRICAGRSPRNSSKCSSIRFGKSRIVHHDAMCFQNGHKG